MLKRFITIIKKQNPFLMILNLLALVIFIGLINFLSSEIDNALPVIVFLVLSHAALVAVNVIKSKKSDQLYHQGNELIKSYFQGDVPETKLSNELKSQKLDEFVVNFNHLLEFLESNRSVVSEVREQIEAQSLQISGIASDLENKMQGHIASANQMQEMVKTLQETVKVASDMAAESIEIANKSESEGNSGKVVMTEAISGVMMLASSVSETNDIIQTLGEESKAIGSIIDVITGVAEQTNLLALNAAIEAARAGEQGRGFAVVADEVRSLASKTRESAQRIHEIITKLLGHVDSANAVINQSMEEADKSDELMEGVMISYAELVGFMVEISALAQSLNDSTSVESNVAAEVDNNVALLNSSSNEVIEQSQQLNATCLQLEQMKERLDSLQELAGAVEYSVPDETDEDSLFNEEFADEEPIEDETFIDASEEPKNEHS